MNATTVGQMIGRAIYRDAIAEGMPLEWTGLDAQDADQIPDALRDQIEQIEQIARETFDRLKESH